PDIGNRVIVFDLDTEPDELLSLPAEDLADRVFVRAADLPEGLARVPLKEVHTNRCPALVRWDHLRPADFDRLGIDPAVAEARARRRSRRWWAGPSPVTGPGRAPGPTWRRRSTRVAPATAPAPAPPRAGPRRRRSSARATSASRTRACPSCCSATAPETSRIRSMPPSARAGTTTAGAACATTAAWASAISTPTSPTSHACAPNMRGAAPENG